jgi:DNA-binding MarR family transcriptional regulator
MQEATQRKTECSNGCGEILPAGAMRNLTKPLILMVMMLRLNENRIMGTKPPRDDFESQDAPAMQGLNVGRLGHLLGFHLRMAHVAIYRDFAETMEELALTQKQLAVMELIAANPGTSQIDLAHTLGTDRATMMALVNRLAARDLIERRPSSADRRRQELHLTKAGRAVLTQARKLIDIHERRFIALFSHDEMDALLVALKRIYQSKQPQNF